MTLPPKDAILARIPEGHPRLFARPETRAVYLAGLKTTYAEPWKRLQATCRRVLKNPPSTEEPRPYAADELRATHPEAWKRKWVSDYKRVLYLTQAMSELAFRWWLDPDAATGDDRAFRDAPRALPHGHGRAAEGHVHARAAGTARLLAGAGRVAVGRGRPRSGGAMNHHRRAVGVSLPA